MKSAKEKPAEKSAESVKIDITKLPDLLGLVDYSYANIVRVSHSAADVRIAFGDFTPLGELKPKLGIVVTKIVALNMVDALQKLVESMKDSADSSPETRSGKN